MTAHQYAGDAGDTVQIEQRILAKNDHLAEHNRQWLADRDILAVNLMSSPGAGKTTLLERSLRTLAERYPVAVVEGDQETVYDADRIRATGAPVLQVNTGAGCHLDASMVGAVLPRLDPPNGAVVFVENVGNLICPALFDLGERAKVVITSTTEGVEKPLKYPHMFRAASLVLLNKIDLLPYVDYPVDRFLSNVRQVNPGVDVLEISATTGAGLDRWYHWLDGQRAGAAGVTSSR